MLEPNQLSVTRPQGEAEIAPAPVASPGAVETFGGKIFVRWDSAAGVTVFGPVTYFIEFLKTSGLWESWVGECPLQYRSPNAPRKEDILGTLLLAVWAGHKRMRTSPRCAATACCRSC